MIVQIEEKVMSLALQQARLCMHHREVPVGAALYCSKTFQVIAVARNDVELKHDASRHAELICMQRAAKKIGDWRLSELDLYCTLEPCVMCLGAAKAFRVNRIVFGAFRDKPDPLRKQFLDSEFSSCGGVLEQECKELLQSFFRNRRLENKHTHL